MENYYLTQSISSCVGIKINSVDAVCVKSDPQSTNIMLNWAYRGGFLTGCTMDLTSSGYDNICYHTSINAAFTS